MNGTALISVDEELQQPPVSFSDLPDDVLFTICRQLDIASLSVLCRVCRKLKDLLSSDHAWLPFDKNFNVLRADNGITLPLKEKFRISCNREKGVYQESLFINFTGRQLPWRRSESIITKLKVAGTDSNHYASRS
nr:F-box/WD repeat-containing protein 4-like [Crassostrea gigas]